MLDGPVIKTLFNIVLPNNIVSNNEVLILSGCKTAVAENKIYSEFEELNCCFLNANDYNCGNMIIHLFFDYAFKNPYLRFYVNCISIRTNDGILCKVDGVSLHDENFTKITKEGKLSICIGYFFRSEREYAKIINCKSFCVEGFAAFGKKNNVFAFMCSIEQNENGWMLSDGNTYKIYKKVNISKLRH